MTVGFHRGLLFWFLLLLPTLGVAGGALWLLAREEMRLASETQSLADTRQSARVARAKLIAENVELLIGDVENGLMSALLEDAPANVTDRDSFTTFADQWKHTNPLVGGIFSVTSGGRVQASDSALKEASWLSAGTPWNARMRDQVAAESDAERQARNEVAANVAQVQNTRKDVQEFASQKIYAPKKNAPAAAVNQERTGWTPVRDNRGLWLVGWHQPASGGVLGVTVNLGEVAARFAGLLPKTGEFANTFEVRESRSSGSPREDQAQVRVPISSAVLPGWEVVSIGSIYSVADRGDGFFLIGALLVVAAVGVIVLAGSLLLWQARRSEAEAAQKTSFVANVSHEFKTPLTTIRLYAELLEQGRVRDAEQGNDYLRTIGRETQRLARLVNNALDFSRLEQGKKKYARENADLAADLTRLLDTHAPRLAEAGLVLQRNLPAGPVPVTTDRDAIEQIVLNLLDNACKYAAEGGEVVVTLSSRNGGGAEIHVADRGPGVSVEHRERIFEKFHRVDDALTAEKSGAGLGLSIARQLARGLGGELRFASRAGAGAEFILELP